jgi:hypothetical protein
MIGSSAPGQLSIVLETLKIFPWAIEQNKNSARVAWRRFDDRKTVEALLYNGQYQLGDIEILTDSSS